MLRKVTKKIAQKSEKILKKYLVLDANSVACIVIGQPKAPESLAKFRKK